PEALLHGVQLAARGDRLDGLQRSPVGLHREHGAALRGAPVEHDRTGPAAGRVAADVGAGELQVLADEVHQQRARLDLAFDLLSVHRQTDLVPAHARAPFSLECASAIARLTTTRVTSRLYSADPRRSLDGSHSPAASFAVASR